MKRKKLVKLIKISPLIAVDLIIINSDNQILLGKRKNRPAKDFWFVPGGRINKNEKINDAMKRILKQELGVDILPDNQVFLGAFEHFYDDCFTGDFGIDTHYIVLAYKLKMDACIIHFANDDQHEEIKWWNYDNVLSDSNVHHNTQIYISHLNHNKIDKNE